MTAPRQHAELAARLRNIECSLLDEDENTTLREAADLLDPPPIKRTIEQADLDAAEKLLSANGYTIAPPAKPLTFDDVVPMTEAPPAGTVYWVVSLSDPEGVTARHWAGSPFAEVLIRRRMAYLKKEDALIAARHIFGLKGGEL